jgi:anaerobic selenocysteine-containing dehydrogenase
MKEFITACPRNCYSTCTFRVQVEGNTIKRIMPYSGNLATPMGPCIKGLSYIERSNSKDRITTALKKSPSGKFIKISMNDALGNIAETLTKIKETSGSESIFWYRGSGMSGLTNEIGYSFWELFGGTTITYGNLCWPAGLEAVRLTMGSVMHNVPWDMVNASVIVIWGKNPAETNIQEMAFIADARDKGCKVIVIDPRRTPTADKADILIRPLPGTDGALALAIAYIIVEENLTDTEFIKNHVYGFDEFRKGLSITPAEAEIITGIPSDTIRELACIIASGDPVTFLPGYGLQRYTNGGQTIRSILSLAIITGNIGKPGAGFNYANLQSYIFDNTREPVSYYPDPEHDKPFRRTISMAKLGIDVLSCAEPEIRAAWIERGNPLLQAPDSGNVRKAFERMEFRVVVDQFMTDTAAIADIILPAKDMFEQSDIIGSYWSPYVQLKPKVLSPEGDIMPESEIYYHLASKMGLNYESANIPEPGDKNIEKWLEKRISSYSGIRLDDLRNGPVLPPGLQLIAYSDMKFLTPSGKIELCSNQMFTIWKCSPVPLFTPLADDDDEKRKFPLIIMTPNTGNRIHSQFGNLDIIKGTTDFPALEISETDAGIRRILSGDSIRIFNDTGSIESTARVTGRVAEGCVVLPNGVWLNEGGGGNFLIAAKETDIGYGAAFHGTRVEVEKNQVR